MQAQGLSWIMIFPQFMYVLCASHTLERLLFFHLLCCSPQCVFLSYEIENVLSVRYACQMHKSPNRTQSPNINKLKMLEYNECTRAVSSMYVSLYVMFMNATLTISDYVRSTHNTSTPQWLTFSMHIQTDRKWLGTGQRWKLRALPRSRSARFVL